MSGTILRRGWGAARGIPRLCFVAEVAAPGLIVIKNHSGETSGKFVNVAVLEGDQIKVVNPHACGISDYPSWFLRGVNHGAIPLCRPCPMPCLHPFRTWRA